MSTEFYADYIKKTTFDPETSSVRNKFHAVKADDVEVSIEVSEEENLDEAATDTKKKPASKTPKVEVEPTEIPEELHGDQDKLDHNKDKKITASDMKKVRSHGPVKEDIVEEGTFKVEVDGLPTMYIDGSAGEIKASLRKKFKDPKAVISVERITPAEKKKELRAKVAEDQAAIDAYLKKGGKITKAPPAKAQGAHGSSDLESGVSGRLSSADTSRFKTQKKVKSMESVEQVDEISKRAKASYVRVAARDIGHQGAQAERGVANNDREAIRAADRKRNNRLQGIDRATKALQKESMMGHSDAEKIGASKDSSHSSAASHIDYHLRRHPQHASASGGERDKLRHQVAKKLGYVGEGAMKRIATQDAEKERLGPRKVKGDGMDTFKKKPVSEGERGLWDNIHAKRKRIKDGSGEKMRTPGSKGAPTKQDFKDSQ